MLVVVKVHKKNMLLYLLGELQKTAAEVQRLKGLLAELQADVDIQGIQATIGHSQDFN